MARGPSKHLKRLCAPKSWMLDKLSGQFAPRPSPGPHRLRESLPLMLVLRNRLKYALTARECLHILKGRNILVDGKVRTDPKFPTGFMDTIEIPTTKQAFRVVFDLKGRHTLVPVEAAEASRKLLKVVKLYYTPGRVPCAATHDGRVIRYPDPLLKKNDTVVFDLKTKTVSDWIRFKKDQLVFCTGGANRGRVGTVSKIERHPGSFHIVHVTDANGATFATRLSNIFVVGRDAPLVTLPKGDGVRVGLVEDRAERIEKFRAIKEREVVGGAKKATKGKKNRA
jgi:small subunit ribosomal protein S4e